MRRYIVYCIWYIVRIYNLTSQNFNREINFSIISCQGSDVEH